MPATYVAVCHFDLPRRPLTRVHRRAVSMQPTTACRIDSLACSPRPLVHSSSTAAAAAAGSTSVGSTGATAAAAGSGVEWRGRAVICLPVNFKRDYALHRGASPGVLACVRAWRPDRTAGRSPDSRCRPSVGWSVVSPCWSLGVNYCGVDDYYVPAECFVSTFLLLLLMLNCSLPPLLDGDTKLLLIRSALL